MKASEEGVVDAHDGDAIRGRIRKELAGLDPTAPAPDDCRSGPRDISVSGAEESIAAAMAADEEPWPQTHGLSTDRHEEETLAAAMNLGMG